ncbi:MAG: DUF5690 family protein [Pirellulales bacterium]|nr:DUF5690 family protein [Pirellulales bacterium]
MVNIAASPRARTVFWTVWSVVAAFGTYFCMYGFRKPFSAAGFDPAVNWWGVDEKSCLVISQVLGYTCSKFLGIKVVSEMPPHRRALAIVVLIGMAQVALLLFGFATPNWRPVCLFFNGLPLGMVFGLVLGFLEGRQLTEALTAGLCVSFIVADGVMKSVGKGLLNSGVSDYWMPASAGGIFIFPLIIFTLMLSVIPGPTPADIAARALRTPYSAMDRWQFLRRFGVGLLPIVVIYLLITILRSLRGDFAPELWQALGVQPNEALFTQTETLVGLVVLLVNGSCALIISNQAAMKVSLATVGLGVAIMIGSLAALRLDQLSPFWFIVLVGMGLYLPYVAVHTTILERFIALTGERGNLGYLMSIVDAIGYLGYVVVILAKNWSKVNFGPSGPPLAAPSAADILKSSTDRSTDLLDFFLWASGIGAALSAVLLIFVYRYFQSHFQSKLVK